MNGWQDSMLSWGQVVTNGVSPGGLPAAVIGPVRKRKKDASR